MTESFEIKRPGKVIVEVTDFGIIISRKGIINAINVGLTGDKTIPFSSIKAVQLKKAGLTNGYIQFSILGGNEQKGGVIAATKDENTIMFSKKYESVAMELKSIVESNINSNLVAPKNKNQKEQLEQIQTLKTLLDSDIITKEEFEQKKKQLLNL
ncbi:SHOCT domain-containing protein [Lactococcus muris]|uniref:SHOCT domain-containing protein n=1 Tax=Lactococcus muris TaxID=2941330 RepID=A0ABV4D9E5_9LACT